MFGVVGSGNFHVTNALDGGRRPLRRRPARGRRRRDGRRLRAGHRGLGVCTVHQGPGLTNALTGITEAAKSRTPLLVLAAEATEPGPTSTSTRPRSPPRSARSPSGSTPPPRRSPTRAVPYRHGARPPHRAADLPLDVQAAAACRSPGPPCRQLRRPPGARRRGGHRAGRRADRGAAAGLHRRPRAPGGRAAELKQLSDACGALLATSAVARGLFRGSPFNLDVSGGFATPVAAELIKDADLRRRLGLRAEHVDDAARHPDRRRRHRGPGGRRPDRARRAPTGSTSASRRHGGDGAARSARSWTGAPADRRRRE